MIALENKLLRLSAMGPGALEQNGLAARIQVKFFRRNTYEKSARKPCIINTSKTKDLNSRKINTYKKHPGGSPPPFPFTGPVYCACQCAHEVFTHV